MWSALLWATLFSLVGCGFSARILAVLPFPGKSHKIFHSSVLKALLEKGHQVVEYGPFPPKKPTPNYTHIEVHTRFEEEFEKWSYEDLEKFSESTSIFGVGAQTIWDFFYDICDETFKHENIKKLLHSKEHFDLVITTSTFGQESMLVFGHIFRAPTVTLQGFSYSSTLSRDSGNDLSIASVPDSMSFIFTNQMTFKERLQNFISVSLTLFLYYYSHLPKHDAILKKHYQFPDTPSVADMVSNISLSLVNSHSATDYPQSFTPNIVQIAGISITPERIELPQDIKMFMDDAKEGVVYFSFGTVIPAHVLPKEVLQIFINVFKRMPQKVLWKIELDSLPGLPKNVKLTKWVPQLGVLGHPNCRAFITHGGVFSQHEAIHSGVPTVGIPFFADQPNNVRFNEHHGIGIKVEFKSLSEETLYSALNAVLKNPKYKENAAHMSSTFRDRPLSAADTAVFWVEYVLRYNGAPHLKSAATQLSWYQLALLDVLAAIMAALLTVFVTLYLVLRKILYLVFGEKKQTKVSKRKKKN